MAYTVFDQTLPDPGNQNGTQVFDSTRENLAAVRDALISTGFFPGWDIEMQNSNGTAPPSVPEQPEQMVASKGAERIKLSLTWGTVGGEAGNVTAILAEYSANSGALYEPMGAVGYPLGTMTISYDVSGSYLSHAWS